MDEQKTEESDGNEVRTNLSEPRATKLCELSFKQKMEIKESVSDGQLHCIIRDINHTGGYVELTVSPESCTSFAKTLTLDSSLYLHKDSEYEEFLKLNGISPIQDDIEAELSDMTIPLHSTVDGNSISLSYKKIEEETSNQTDGSKKSSSNIRYRGLSKESPFGD